MGFKDSVVNLIIRGKDLLSPATDSAAQSMGVLQERSNELNAELKRLTMLERNIKEFKRLGTETDRLQQNWQAAQAEAARLKSALDSAATPTKALTRDYERASKAAEEANGAWRRNRDAIDKLTPRLKAAGFGLSNLDAAQEGLEQSSRRLRADLSGVNTALDKQQAEAREAGAAVRGAGADADNFGSRIRSAAVGIAAFIAASVGLDKLRAVLVSIFKTGDQFEKLDQQFTQIFGSLEAGEQASKWVQDFAARTPLQLEEVSKAFIRLKNFGIDPTNGTLQALVDQNEVMGGSFQDLEGIVNAVGQAWSKQKLQGEEILQLIERGVPVWELLAEATGKSVPELQKLSSAGELGRETIAALVAEIGKASDGAAANSMGRLSGLVSNLTDQWSQFLNRVAESGALDWLKGQLDALLVTIEKMKADGRLDEWAKNIGDSIVSTGQALKSSVQFVVEYKNQLLILAQAFVAIKAVNAVKGLLSWTVALRASRAEMAAAAAQAATTTTGIAALGGRLAALARPIPITLAIIGYEAVTWAIDAVTAKIYKLDEAKQFLKLREQELQVEQLRSVNATLRQAESLQQYAGIANKTAADLRRMSQQERDDYAASLDSSKEYYTYTIDALKRAAELGEDVSSRLQEARSGMEQVAQGLDAVAEASARASEALRLGVSEAAIDALTAFTNLKREGVSTSDAIQQSFGNLDLATPDGIATFNQALVSLVKTGQVSAEEIERFLSKAFDGLPAEQVAEFARQFMASMQGIEGSAEQTASVINQSLKGALERLGVDVALVTTGINKVGQESIDAFGQVVDSVTEAGYTAEQQSEIIAAAFKDAFGKVSTDKGLDALRAKLKQAFDEGKISLEDYNKALGVATEKQADAVDSVADLGGQAELTGKKLHDMGEAGEQAGNDTRSSMERAASAAAGIGGFYDGITARLAAMSRAAVDSFREIRGGSKLPGDDVDSLRARIDDLGRSITALGQPYGADFIGITRWMRSTARDAAIVERSFLQQKVAVQNLLDEFDRGNFSAGAFRQSVASLDSQFNLLDDQDLSALRSAVQSVQNEVDGLTDSLQDTVSSLRQELAGLQGDTAEVERLRYIEQRSELEERLNRARKLGDADAIAAGQQALSLQEQTYALKKSQAQQQSEEARIQAAANAAEQERQRQEQERQQREQIQTDSRREQQAVSSSTAASRTIILQGPSGNSAEVVVTGDQQEQDLLTVLEEIGYRSIG